MKNKVKMRPRGEARRRAMLDAAATLFAERGFEGTSLSAIIERSGGSRATLYEMFGGKEGLFEAMVTEGCQRVIEPLETKAIEGRLPEDVLRNFGLHVAAQMTTVASQALTKILATDGHRLPKVVDFFFRQVLDNVRDRLSDYLRQATEAGHLIVVDPDAAASLFLSMVEGEGMIRRAFGAPRQLSDAEIRARVSMATEVFLNGMKRRASPR